MTTTRTPRAGAFTRANTAIALDARAGGAVRFSKRAHKRVARARETMHASNG